MYFLLKSIEAIIIINANTKKFSNSKLSFIMTKRMQVKTIAKNGVIFFIGKYTKNYLRMCFKYSITLPRLVFDLG